MDKTAEFIRICHTAAIEAEKAEAVFARDQRLERYAEEVRKVRDTILGYAKRAEEGRLHPSEGHIRLGLTRWISEWGIPAEDLYASCMDVEEFYLKNL
ncbi:MAG: hypothetical protein ACYC41_04310 [Bacillota bacterium]